MSGTEKASSDSLNKIVIPQDDSLVAEIGQGQLYDPPLRRTRKLSTMLLCHFQLHLSPLVLAEI